MWTGVATRKHTPRNLYVRDENGNDLMLIGELLYGLENGKRVVSLPFLSHLKLPNRPIKLLLIKSIDFAARIVFGESSSFHPILTQRLIRIVRTCCSGRRRFDENPAISSEYKLCSTLESHFADHPILSGLARCLSTSDRIKRVNRIIPM